MILKRLYFFSTIILLLLNLVSSAAAETTAGSNWVFNDRDFRIFLSVNPNGHARTDKVVDFNVDFAAELTARGAVDSFDEDSVRVAEVTSSGVLIDDSVTFQFDNGTTLDNPQGTVVFLMSGSTGANTTRYYQIYFDTQGTFSAPPTVTDRVLLFSEQGYRGQLSYRIRTFDSDSVTLNSEYFYHKKGGGFASIFDRDSNDWVSYYKDPNSLSGGEYRGLPNLGNVFHPGYSNTSGSAMQSRSNIVDDGPIRLSIESESWDREWLVRWDIYPTYARMTVLDIPDNEKYWFLYEGTPGGNLDYSGQNLDVIVRSDGQPNINANQMWLEENQELGSASPTAPGEWMYFADSATDRIFYVTHDQDDSEYDSYRHQYNGTQTPPPSSSDNGAMTVAGFGRKTTTGVTRYLTAVGATFTIGFGESQILGNAQATINNAFQALTIEIVNEPPMLTTNEPLTLSEGQTAVLSENELLVIDPNGDTVTYQLTAIPDHGTLSNNGNPLNVNDSFSQADINNGLITYAHDGGEENSDSFTAIPMDGQLSIDAITFSFIINGVNDPPLANPDTLFAVSGSSVTINVLTNDSDPEQASISVSNITQPTHGSTTLNPDGTITYSSNLGYTGADSFTYKITDGVLKSPSTTVSVTVGERLFIYLPLITR